MNIPSEYKNIISETAQIYNCPPRREGCLDEGLLNDYLQGILDEPLTRVIADHIAACEPCHLTKLRVEADQTGFDLSLERTPDETLSKMLGPEGIRRLADLLHRKRRSKVHGRVSQIREALVVWATPLWEPLMVGRTLTAADLPEQSQQFEMDYGEYINLSCFWQGHDRGAEPHVRLTWRANLILPGNLWVRFVNPDTQAIYVELPLGEALEGEARFDQTELGFDPAGEKWAVSIVVAKNDK